MILSCIFSFLSFFFPLLKVLGKSECRKNSEEENGEGSFPGSWALLACTVQQGVIKREVKSKLVVSGRVDEFANRSIKEGRCGRASRLRLQLESFKGGPVHSR